MCASRNEVFGMEILMLMVYPVATYFLIKLAFFMMFHEKITLKRFFTFDADV